MTSSLHFVSFLNGDLLRDSAPNTVIKSTINFNHKSKQHKISRMSRCLGENNPRYLAKSDCCFALSISALAIICLAILSQAKEGGDSLCLGNRACA